ncbi:MAG: GEVED domain-containing protein [Polaribacter sp.]|uniref:GEVED domain-containing protein n=1 Tax=Polaribacter sp. TaxID=1920175 RepID=UPI0032641CA7
MKQILQTSLLFISIVCCSTTGFSQEWYEMINKEPVNIEKVKEAAKPYFDKIGRGKHTGYKLYQRWLDEALQNMDKHGIPYTNNHVAKELKKFRASTSERATMLNTSSATTDADGNWQPIGPFYSQDNHHSKRLGRITAMAIEPVEQKLIFAGSESGGVFRSKDAGTSWVALSDQLDNMFVFALAIDPHDTDHILFLNGNTELIESLDQGDTWNQIASFDRFINNVQMIKFHPTIQGMFFVSTRDGLMKTIDGGNTFTTKLGQYDPNDIFFKPGDPTTMYVGEDDFWKSTDTGETWTKITSGINVSERLKITVTPADPNCVYIFQQAGNGAGRIYKSTDSGTTFNIMADSAVLDADDYLGSQAWRCMTIMCSETDVNELHMGGLRNFRSDDGGVTIYEMPNTQTTSGPAHFHADVLIMENVNGTLYVASDGGIFRSIDGGDSYKCLSGDGAMGNSMMPTQIIRIGGTSPYPGTGAGLDPDLILTGAMDNGTQIARGDTHTWEQWLGSDGMECFVDYTNSDNIYGSAQSGVLFYSKNGGNSFGVLKRPETTGSSPTPFLMDATTPTTLYVGYNDLYMSKNSGEDWEKMTSGQTNNVYIKGLAVAPTDNNYIYFSSSYQLWVSTNAQSSSRTWQEISGISGYITYIAVDPNDPTHALITTSGDGIWETKDAGVTITEISGNLPDISARCILMDNSTENTIYVGMAQGVYYKNDNMTNWEIFGNGLPNCAARELEIHYQANKLRVGTWGRGIWEIPIFGNGATLTDYCESEGESVVDEWIDRVQFGSIDNSSGVNGGYADFTSTHSITLAPGATETITITPAWSGTVYSEGYAVWIDFNKDGDFSDAGEQVYTQAATSSTPVSGTITIPAGTSLNTTTMRVSMQYNAIPDSCDSFGYGEVEDYEIVIGGTSDTGMPTGYCASNGENSDFEWIDLVQLGSINNVSGNDGGYEDYTNLSTNLLTGTQYTISFSTGFSGTSYTEFWYVFIDYNRDGDFADAGEQVATTSSNSSGTLTANFTVPSGISLGTTRMRVKMTDGASTDSCETDFSYGEVEDYAVNLLNTSTNQKSVLSNTNTEVSEELDGVLYPNPTNDFLNLNLDSLEGIAITISTVNGQIVKQGVFASNNRIDVRKLTSGVYFLKIEDGQTEKRYKFIKR